MNANISICHMFQNRHVEVQYDKIEQLFCIPFSLLSAESLVLSNSPATKKRPFDKCLFKLLLTPFDFLFKNLNGSENN